MSSFWGSLYYSELEKRVVSLEKENRLKDQNLIDSLIAWKKKQELRSEIIAKRCLNIFVYSFLSVLIIIFYSLYSTISNNWNKIEPIIILISVVPAFVLKVLGKKYDPFQLQLKIYDKIFNKVYKKKLRHINEFESYLLLSGQRSYIIGKNSFSEP